MAKAPAMRPSRAFLGSARSRPMRRKTTLRVVANEEDGDGEGGTARWQKKLMDRENKVEVRTSEVKEAVKQRLPLLLAEVASASEAQDAQSEIALPNNLQARLRGSVSQLKTGLVERDAEVRLILLATLCGEHLLLLGAPGTAKSELSRRLGTLVQGKYFERLLTRFSVPEELFGPLSMKGLEEDRYERQTRGYLPEASVAFVDEIFKANSAILNALLSILNERLFDNGNKRVEVPLVCMVGASNELPESEELDALYDRFLFRREVKQVSADNVPALLQLAARQGTFDLGEEESGSVDFFEAQPLSVEELRAVKDQALAETKLPQEIVDLLCDMREFLQEKNEPPVYVSDRRLVKIVSLLRVMAYTNGRKNVNEYDCLMLQHTMWQRPEESEIIREWVLQRIAQDKGTNQVWYLLFGIFRRACHAQKDMPGDEEVCQQLLTETRQLREVLVSQLQGLADTKDGSLPVLRDHLWLSQGDIKRTTQTLNPMLKKARTSLEKLLEETLILEVALEKGPEPYMLALLLPEYWGKFIRNGPLEESR